MEKKVFFSISMVSLDHGGHSYALPLFSYPAAAATARPVTASAFSRAAAPAPAAARRASKLPASRLAPSSLSNKASISTKAVAAPITSPAPGPPQTLVFVSAEVAPFSKTGGLGDVLNGLPATLASRGHRVVTIAPRCVCF